MKKAVPPTLMGYSKNSGVSPSALPTTGEGGEKTASILNTRNGHTQALMLLARSKDALEMVM